MKLVVLFLIFNLLMAVLGKKNNNVTEVVSVAESIFGFSFCTKCLQPSYIDCLRCAYPVAGITASMVFLGYATMGAEAVVYYFHAIHDFIKDLIMNLLQLVNSTESTTEQVTSGYDIPTTEAPSLFNTDPDLESFNLDGGNLSEYLDPDYDPQIITNEKPFQYPETDFESPGFNEGGPPHYPNPDFESPGFYDGKPPHYPNPDFEFPSFNDGKPPHYPNPDFESPGFNNGKPPHYPNPDFEFPSFNDGKPPHYPPEYETGVDAWNGNHHQYNVSGIEVNTIPHPAFDTGVLLPGKGHDDDNDCDEEDDDCDDDPFQLHKPNKAKPIKTNDKQMLWNILRKRLGQQ